MLPPPPRQRSTTQQPRRRFVWETFANNERLGELFLDRATISLDLSRYDILSHDGLCWILALAAWRTSGGLGATFIRLPSDIRVLSYLSTIRFLKRFTEAGGAYENGYVLDDGRIVDLNMQRTDRFGEPSEYSPTIIQRIEEHRWDHVLHALDRFFDTDLARVLETTLMSETMEASRPFQAAIRELVMNVAMHGGKTPGSGVGYCCYRPFPSTYRAIRFSCSDIGVGFRSSLLRQSRVQSGLSDTDAILSALLFRFDNPQEGVIGLYPALGFLRSFNGRLSIRSGEALVSLDLTSANTRTLFDDCYEDEPTLVWLRKLCHSYIAPAVGGTHVIVDLQLPNRL